MGEVDRNTEREKLEQLLLTASKLRGYSKEEIAGLDLKQMIYQLENNNVLKKAIELYVANATQSDVATVATTTSPDESSAKPEAGKVGVIGKPGVSRNTLKGLISRVNDL